MVMLSYLFQFPWLLLRMALLNVVMKKKIKKENSHFSYSAISRLVEIDWFERLKVTFYSYGIIIL